MTRDLDRRLSALAGAVELADGRLEPEPVEAARAVVQRAGRRLGLGVEATVVALAGATGAGKSSLFNALAGAELAAAGVRRPTTAAPTAAVWGDVGSDLLDWLQVPRRHAMGTGALDGLVLLDLPDFDSVERNHRLEVERVLELVDMVVWVLDPQKYADAALHDRYLRPLAAHEATMLVALNQADRLSGDELARCRADLRRLLGEDGLERTPVLAVSARTGAGLDELHSALVQRVAAREAAVARLAADLSTAAAGLAGACGDGRAGAVRRSERERLQAALADAAGVPVVVRAVDRAHRRRGALATGWPFVRWLRRLRPDPLRRLRLETGSATPDRTSLPGPSPVQRAQAEAASRALAAEAAGGLPSPWPGLVRSAATRARDDVADRLDRAVGGTDLRAGEPRWWAMAGWLQRVFGALAAVGALWLLALAALGYLQLGDIVPTPHWQGFALPTLLLAGGVLAGALLAFLARLINGAGARRRARRAGSALRERVAGVGEELVIGPVEEELAAREQLCRALEQAAGGGGRRR